MFSSLFDLTGLIPRSMFHSMKFRRLAGCRGGTRRTAFNPRQPKGNPGVGDDGDCESAGGPGAAGQNLR